jgi:hypothetical protein
VRRALFRSVLSVLITYIRFLVFRDQLYKHLETVPENDFEGFSAKLIQAGGTLEYLKYADALFEILLVGGLIQPGGSYLDDGAPMSPFSIFNARSPPEIDELKKYVDVFNKLNRRYVQVVISRVEAGLIRIAGSNIFRNHLRSRVFQLSYSISAVGQPSSAISLP